MINFDADVLMNDAEFMAKIKAAEDSKEIVKLFEEKGFDISEEDVNKAFSCLENDEFSEDELENVSGGLGVAFLGLIAVIGFARGLRCK